MKADRPRWNIYFHREAEKALKKLPKEVVERIWEKIKTLEYDPRPTGCKKLQGRYDNHYRIRVGNWRISYAIEEQELIILVLEIAPRGGAYRHR
jgi:mRNA interferase RelE/StbE